MRMRDLITIVENASGALYHVSNNPNLEINPEHELAQGQLGKGFYVSRDPDVWRASLGERKYMYRLVDPSKLIIATDKDYPGSKTLAEWAVEKGYMRMAPVVRPDGRPVQDLDGGPLIRPEVTPAGAKFLWKDPMTGGGLKGLEIEYLRDKGFNAYEPGYSRDGHQIIIFDLSVVELQKVR